MRINSTIVPRNKPAFPEVEKTTIVNGVSVTESVRRGPIPVCRLTITPDVTHGPRMYRINKGVGQWNVSAILSFVDMKRPMTDTERAKGKRDEEDISKMKEWEWWQKFGKPYSVIKTKGELFRFINCFTKSDKDTTTWVSFLSMDKGTATINVSTDKGKTWHPDFDAEVFKWDDTVGDNPWRYRVAELRDINQNDPKFKVKVVKTNQ